MTFRVKAKNRNNVYLKKLNIVVAPPPETPSRTRIQQNYSLKDARTFKKMNLFTGEQANMLDIWIRQGKRSPNFGIQYNEMAQQGKKFKDEAWNQFLTTPLLEHMTAKDKTIKFGKIWQQMYSQHRMDAAMKIVVLQELSVNFMFFMGFARFSLRLCSLLSLWELL